ncbi:MAG: hypothetical protein V3U29_10180 [Phycisphaeraceae bacterium]
MYCWIQVDREYWYGPLHDGRMTIRERVARVWKADDSPNEWQWEGAGRRGREKSFESAKRAAEEAVKAATDQEQ